MLGEPETSWNLGVWALICRHCYVSILFQTRVCFWPMPGSDKGSLPPGHPLRGVTLQAVLQGTAQPSPHLWALQEIHSETLCCSHSSLQQRGCAAGPSMTAVWHSLQSLGFWCSYLYKHFSVLFPSCLALILFPCPCFFPPFHVYFSQFLCCFLPFILLIFSLCCFPAVTLSPHCAPPPRITNALSFPHYCPSLKVFWVTWGLWS